MGTRSKLVGRSDSVTINAYSVVVKHRLPLEQIQAPPVEAPALCREDAYRAAGRYLHVGTDFERLVQNARRASFGYTCHAGVVAEHGPAPSQAGPIVDVHAFDFAVVQRQYVVLRRLDPELLLQLAKFPRLLGCKIVGLAEVLRDVVEFPFVIVHVDRLPNGPRCERWRRRCNPAIAVEGAIGEHLEILS